MEAEQAIQLAGNMLLRQSQLDVEVKGIGLDFRTKLTFAPACFFWLKNYCAFLTLIPMEAVTSDPPLNSMLHKFEIDYGLAILRMLEELDRGALWT